MVMLGPFPLTDQENILRIVRYPFESGLMPVPRFAGAKTQFSRGDYKPKSIRRAVPPPRPDRPRIS